MQINLISFSLLSQEVELDLFTEKAENQYPESLFKDEAPELWEQVKELADKNRLLFSKTDNSEIECKGEKYTIQLDLSKNIRVAKHLITGKLYNYFKSVAVVGVDYIDNLEVWIKDENQPDKRTTRYLRFSLVPQYQEFTNNWELLVSFNGISTAYNQPVANLNIQTMQYRVIANGEIVKNKRLTPEHKKDLNTVFPIVNRFLVAELGVRELRYKPDNKYIDVYTQINKFVEKHLFVSDIQKIINITSPELIQIPTPRILHVNADANTLLFGNNEKHIIPHYGFTGNGPYKTPTKNNIRFFFIYHKADQKTCMRLYNIFSQGIDSDMNLLPNEKDTPDIIAKKEAERKKKRFSPLSTLIGQPFNTVNKGSIVFENLNTALSEIESQLLDKTRDNSYEYVALYVSPVSKNEASVHHKIYYKVKELLLSKGITSQVIHKESPTKSSFKYYLPNIAIALLAKMGGIPWQLQTLNSNNDLIVGVGAFKSEEIGKRYIGSAFCFNKEGVFKNFDCYSDNNLENLVAGIRRALGHFLIDSNNPKRVIIHYYKTMGKRESKPILDMLYQLGFNIPVYIVIINKTEANDIVAFDNSCEDLMPISGTIVQIRDNQFLLYNNAKYSQSPIKEILFPIKIRVSKVRPLNAEKEEFTSLEATEMLNQVYQLSRMYWKSVKQQNLPITIKYPEMVAKIVPHFSDAELPPFGKSNLWFL